MCIPNGAWNLEPSIFSIQVDRGFSLELCSAMQRFWDATVQYSVLGIECYCKLFEKSRDFN